MRKLTAALLLAGAALTHSATVVADSGGSSVKSMALQCAVLYNLMESPDNPHDKSNAMLSDQAIIMGSIYSIVSGASGTPQTAQEFSATRTMVKESLISQYMMNSNTIVEKLINCEGWREEVLLFLMQESAEMSDRSDQSAIKDLFARVPAPKNEYTFEGVSKLEISLAVDKAFTQHR